MNHLKKYKKTLITIGVAGLALFLLPLIARFGIDQWAARTECFVLSSTDADKPALRTNRQHSELTQGPDVRMTAGAKYQVIELPGNFVYGVFPGFKVGGVEVRDRRTGESYYVSALTVVRSQPVRCR